MRKKALLSPHDEPVGDAHSFLQPRLEGVRRDRLNPLREAAVTANIALAVRVIVAKFEIEQIDSRLWTLTRQHPRAFAIPTRTAARQRRTRILAQSVRPAECTACAGMG